jgi:S1-C subfamily serine protease
MAHHPHTRVPSRRDAIDREPVRQRPRRLRRKASLQLVDAVDRIRRSVVQIRPPLQLSPATIGSGFIVGDATHVVTAKHVIDAVNSVFVAFAMLNVDAGHFKMRGGFFGTPAQVVDVSADHDLALLHVPEAPGSASAIRVGPRAVSMELAPARISTTRLREGASIAISGYPLSEPSLVTTAVPALTPDSPDLLIGIP